MHLTIPADVINYNTCNGSGGSSSGGGGSFGGGEQVYNVWPWRTHTRIHKSRLEN